MASLSPVYPATPATPETPPSSLTASYLLPPPLERRTLMHPHLIRAQSIANMDLSPTSRILLDEHRRDRDSLMELLESANKRNKIQEETIAALTKEQESILALADEVIKKSKTALAFKRAFTPSEEKELEKASKKLEKRVKKPKISVY
jgi:hypothetical protein